MLDILFIGINQKINGAYPFPMAVAGFSFLFNFYSVCIIDLVIKLSYVYKTSTCTEIYTVNGKMQKCKNVGWTTSDQCSVNLNIYLS